MAQEKILGDQLNIQDVSSEISIDVAAVLTLESAINHNNIINGGGTNSHTQIDSHITNSAIHFTTLNGLSDVSAGSPIVGQVLTYSNSPAGWIPSNPVGGVTNPLSANLNTAGYTLFTANVAAGSAGYISIYGGSTTDAAALKPAGISLYAGSATAGINSNNYSAGDISLQAGHMQPYGSGTNISGGGISLNAGVGYGSVAGGNINIASGSSDSGSAGSLNISSGYSASGNGGYISVYAGSSSSAVGGNLSIHAGNTTTGTPGVTTIRGANGGSVNAGGNIIIKAGLGVSDGSTIFEGASGNSNAQIKLHSGINNADVVLATTTIAADTLFVFPPDTGTTGQVLMRGAASGITEWTFPKTPIYTIATLPVVVEGGTIYVSDATTGVGSPLADTGVQCFGRGTGSPAIWVDVITGLAVA